MSCLLNYIVSSTSSISFDLSAQFINIWTSLQITNLPTNHTEAFPYFSIYLNCLLVWLSFPLPTRVCNSRLHCSAPYSLGLDGTRLLLLLDAVSCPCSLSARTCSGSSTGCSLYLLLTRCYSLGLSIPNIPWTSSFISVSGICSNDVYFKRHIFLKSRIMFPVAFCRSQTNNRIHFLPKVFSFIHPLHRGNSHD